MAKMDEAALKKALPDEVVGKLPIDPGESLLRHIVAGEVYLDQEPKSEVILMAADRNFVEQLIDSMEKTRAEIAEREKKNQAMLKVLQDKVGKVTRNVAP